MGMVSVCSLVLKLGLKIVLKFSAFVLASKDGLRLSFKKIERELFPDVNPREFRHFKKHLGFPLFSFSFQATKDFFFFYIKFWT